MNNWLLKPIWVLLSLACLNVSCKRETADTGEFVDLEMYKYDTTKLNSIANTVNVTLVDGIFAIDRGRLYVKKPDNLIQRKYTITIPNTIPTPFTVKIRDWKTNDYTLQETPNDNVVPLLIKQDTMFFLHDHQLKYTVNDGQAISCGYFDLKQPYYNEFIAENGMYALRVHEMLYMSRDLKNWRLIYQNKRGINKSMAFVKNPTNNIQELIFSEYTPGVERFRHNIFKYNYATAKIRTVMTFYKRDEGISPFARHIHILEKDPYTGDIWVGTGDTDDESHIYRSTDNGETFQLVGTGSQKWRILAFIFTADYIFWNTDSHEPQYLTRVERKDLITGTPVDEKRLKRFSIINSACWGVYPIKTSDGKDMWVMSSNNEGGIYDNYCRTYGIIIDNGVPTFYELGKMQARTVYTQLFPIGVNSNGTLVLYDHEKAILHNYTITKQDLE